MSECCTLAPNSFNHNTLNILFFSPYDTINTHSLNHDRISQSELPNVLYNGVFSSAFTCCIRIYVNCSMRMERTHTYTQDEIRWKNFRSHFLHLMHPSARTEWQPDQMQSIILGGGNNIFFFESKANWFGFWSFFFSLNFIEMRPIWIRIGKLTNAARGYYGAHLGKLTELHHGVSGDVYAVDSRTLFLRNFFYDGEGPGNIFNIFYGGNRYSSAFFRCCK